eukprot:CAMPEP_0194762984 /NCGR_PEP_ID=MMETSP0323_2-20130528/17468_1 /TAXON_ID=2866 ORGANISM="Crypthecodinium cohnii, Strain Seligo" /NCGR_SAMPLE_ID=MMETSP0323_2 /ASSEMBLY_ACC=CAM_ASM_000346 /LENGTH=61 /DNA_ID=CAMNT_0039686669 /DNA_START=211 /DNA_END=393 /DNA_ORIENTATION=+
MTGGWQGLAITSPVGTGKVARPGQSQRPTKIAAHACARSCWHTGCYEDEEDWRSLFHRGPM